MLAHFAFVELRAQDLEGHFLVFDLGSAVLAADVEAGGEVEDLDGGFGAVDVLAAGAARATDFDAEIFGFEFDIDFLGFREDGDGDGGGVDAALGFGGGDALDAVDAGFVFEMAEDLIAGDAEDDFLEAADFGGAAFEVFAAPAAALGVALIETHQLRSEEGGFVTTGTGADFDEGVAVLVRIGGEEGVLEVAGELFSFGFEEWDFLGGHFREVAVGGFREVEIFDVAAIDVLEAVPEVEGLFELAVFAEESRGAFRVIEKRWIADRFLQFGEAVATFGDQLGVVHGGLGRFDTRESAGGGGKRISESEWR